jgi:UDP-N-acetylglucosamine 2-epimerase
MTDRIRIAVVTTTRAEFHILEPLLSALNDDERFGLQLIVSGTHFPGPMAQLSMKFEVAFPTWWRLTLNSSRATRKRW